MSIFHYETYYCAVCDAEVDCLRTPSMGVYGSRDLDGRPPETKRSALRYSVQECPCCGYANRTVEDFVPPFVTEDWLRSEAYQTCEGHRLKGEFARAHYHYYMLCKADQENREAFDAILNAAWLCDDEKDRDGAIACRLIALDRMKDCGYKKWSPEYALLRADLLRRAEQFDRVPKETRVFLWPRGSRKQKTLHAFERQRAALHDAACYTVDQALQMMQSNDA